MNTVQKTKISPILKAFWGFSVAFLVMALLASDRADMLTGLKNIIFYPSQVTTDYFVIGGVSATFLNVGLLGIVCCLLMSIPGYKIVGASGIAFFLTTGFAFFGMNVINVWPCLGGAFLYALLHKKPMASVVNFGIFATGLSPFVSDMLWRYPGLEIHGFTLFGVCMALLIGGLFGYLTAAGCAHSPNVHKGFSIYSAALPIGMMGFLMRAILYTSLGGELDEMQAVLSDGYQVLCTAFCVVAFVLCIGYGYWVNGKSFQGLKEMLKDTGHKVDFTAKYGHGLSLISLGLFGLAAVAYYIAIGATWTGPTIGVVFCMISVGFAGAHLGNIWPVALGYVLASLVSVYDLNAQSIVVGLCFAMGIAPVAGVYGWVWGVIAGGLHSLLVTSVPALYGGLCLYNGGFTVCLVVIVLVPILEHFAKTKAERLELKIAKTK
ncbi:MAG: DUF1576 domain-containing protein [Eubacteriales bacterium]